MIGLQVREYANYSRFMCSSRPADVDDGRNSITRSKSSCVTAERLINNGTVPKPINVVSDCVLAGKLKRTNGESSSVPTFPKKFCSWLQSTTPSHSVLAHLSHMLLGMACIGAGTQELVPLDVLHEHHEHLLLSTHPR